ncbi:MAG: glycerol-3-phosphate 1-O-acyltransferase PlsY [Desulfobulbaceae bacterium]|nr:glycerol-3-phosphate 1-O-acyltransferase PlsY [Desulfobulbaceae bacterium]
MDMVSLASSDLGRYGLIICSYLIGSIPFGLVLGKLKGVDVRQGGSRNIGATNVTRQLGKGLGILTLLGDTGKGLLPMLVVGSLLHGRADAELWVVLSGGAAFLGHLFPIYLRFVGGKGVATALGVFLYLDPLATLVDVLIFVGVVYNWGFVSLGSLSAALMMPGLIWLRTGSVAYTALATVIGILIWIKHHENIGRLRRHEEKSWRKDGGKR